MRTAAPRTPADGPSEFMLEDDAYLESDPFEEPESVQVRIDGIVHGLDPAYVPASRLSALIMTGIFIVVGVVGNVIFWIAADGLSTSGKVSISSGIFALIVAIFVLAYTWPPLELARTSWRVDTEGIEIKRGVLFRHVISVPGTRIQHMDVTQGPIQRRFGLGTLVVHTAGTHESEVNLEGVTRETALAVRDFLLINGPNRERTTDGA